MVRALFSLWQAARGKRHAASGTRTTFRRMKRFLAPLAVLLAPDIGEAQRADSAGTDTTKLPAVTVTATRASASIFAVPFAVTVIDPSRYSAKRGYSLDDAVASVPGVLAQSRYGTSDIRLNIRGFGARGAGDRSNAGTSRGIRVLVDGIPETEPDGRTSFDLIDLAAASGVEVVRSNASALWGNAGGGVVSIKTVPEFESAFASAAQMAGSYGFQRTALQAGAPLGPASLAVTFTNTMQDGYRRHSDSRRALVNASVTSPVGESTKLGVFLSAANHLFHIPGPLTMAEYQSDPRAANATYASRDERRHNRLGRLGVTLEHELSESSTISSAIFVNPKYLQRSERGTFRDFNRHHFGGNVVYRNSYDISSSIAATTTAGAEGALQDGAILFYSLTSAGTRGTELRDNKGEGAQNTGVFAQQQLLFSDRIGIDLGARWDRIRYDYRSYINPRLNDVKDFSRLTPRVGVNYRLGPTHSVYAAIGGGVEAPAGNETDPASTFGQDTVTAINPLLDPIHSTTYEVGTKRLIPFNGGRLTHFSYELALYDTHVTNEIVPYRGGRFYFTAGKASRRGAEVGASIGGASDLTVSGSLTLSRNRYVDYTVDSVHYGRAGSFADYGGNEIAGVPSLLYSLSAGRGFGANVPLRMEIGVRGIGEYFIDDANTVEVPAYHTFSATLSTGKGIAIGDFSLGAFVTIENLADRKFIGSAFVNPDVVNGVPVAFEPGARRSWIFSVSIGPGR
jgi:iron complex outermembrane receptor protein